MEKIYFDESTFIWKTKLNLSSLKEEILTEALNIIKSKPDLESIGAFPYENGYNNNLDFFGKIKIKTKLDEIVQKSINYCTELYTEKNINYNKINTGCWINVVRSLNPVQFKDRQIGDTNKFHTHTEINASVGSFVPYYTYVYYIQMPDIMNDKDGVLYFKSKDDKEYWIRPEEDDLIIMEADMPHSPNDAPNSTIDRIVIAGNVGFEYIKKQKSLL